MKYFIKLFMLSLIFSFVLLGIWQLNRMEWKNDLIIAAQTNSTLAPLNSLPKNLDNTNLYRQVNFKAQLVKNTKHVIIPESYKQKFYYRVMAPMVIENKTILVDFGLAQDKNTKLKDSLKGRAIIFNFDRKNIFYPGNKPEKLVWYNTDYQTIRNYLGINIEPYYLKIVPGYGVSDNFIVKPFATSYRNDHLMYAITWFLLAFFCSIIFYFKVKTK